jgi:folate-binding protein YgfZ
MNKWIALPSRSVIAISGKDNQIFLHGLVTQNLMNSGPWFTALLTPQGRFHSDFFVIPFQGMLLIDCDKKHKKNIQSVLEKFKILHDVQIKDVSKDYAVCAAFGPQVVALLHMEKPMLLGDCGEIFYKDPRNTAMGVRALIPYERFSYLPHTLLTPCDESSYHYHRLQHVIAEGAYDLMTDKSIILEYGYQDMGAICWEKGCYIGQELMAHAFHKGEIRKKSYGLRSINDPFPPLGTELFYKNKKIGRMGSHCKDLGLSSLYISSVCALSLQEAFTIHWGEKRHLLAYIFLPNGEKYNIVNSSANIT